MTPRDELLAAVAELDRHIARLPEACAYSKYAEPEYRIIRDWLDLEAEVLACRTPAPEIVAWIPSVRMARWINGDSPRGEEGE